MESGVWISEGFSPFPEERAHWAVTVCAEDTACACFLRVYNFVSCQADAGFLDGSNGNSGPGVSVLSVQGAALHRRCYSSSSGSERCAVLGRTQDLDLIPFGLCGPQSRSLCWFCSAPFCSNKSQQWAQLYPSAVDLSVNHRAWGWCQGPWYIGNSDVALSVGCRTSKIVGGR